MKYNNHIIPVFTRFQQDEVFTEGDIVFGINSALTDYNPLVLMKCKKETIKGNPADAEHFEPFVTSAYAGAARSYEQFSRAANDALLTKNALVETLERLVGKNLNSNGTNKYLPKGADFNQMQNDGRWLLNPNYSYANVPVTMTGWQNYAAVIYEAYTLDNLNVQIVTCYKTDSNWFILRRSKSPSANWSTVAWTTDQQQPLKNSFINEYKLMAVNYFESLRLLNAYADSIRNSAVAIIGEPNKPGFYNLPCRFKALNLPAGYFEIQILPSTIVNNQDRLVEGGEQAIAAFTSEDVEHVKFDKTSIQLASSKDDITITLAYNSSASANTYVDGTTIQAKDVVLTISGTGKAYVKILKLPLKVAENG